jgi:hypothetical protein
MNVISAGLTITEGKVGYNHPGGMTKSRGLGLTTGVP